MAGAPPPGASAPLRGGALLGAVVEAAPEALLGALTQDLSCAPLWLGHHRRRGNRAVLCSPWEEGPAVESLFSEGSPHGLALRHRCVEFLMTNSGTPLLRGEHRCFEEHYLLLAEGDSRGESPAKRYVLELQARTPTAPYGEDCHARVRFEICGIDAGRVPQPTSPQQCSLEVTYEVRIRGGLSALTQGMIGRGMAAGLKDNYRRCFLPSLKEIFPVRDVGEGPHKPQRAGGVSEAFAFAATALVSPAASRAKRRESSVEGALEGVAPWVATLARAAAASDEAGAVVASLLVCYAARSLSSGLLLPRGGPRAEDEEVAAAASVDPPPSQSLWPLGCWDFTLSIALYFSVLLGMRALNYSSATAILLDAPSVLLLRVQGLLGVLQRGITHGAGAGDRARALQRRMSHHRRTHSVASIASEGGGGSPGESLSPGAYVPAAAEAALKAAAVASLAGLTPAEQAAAVSGIKDTAQQSIVTQYLQGQAVATLAGLGGERIAAEVYENERFQPFRGWGSTWPGHFLPTDGCGKWSTRDFQPKGPSNMVFELVAPPLPPGFDWLEESWAVDRSGVPSGATDAEGWFYGGMAFHKLNAWPPERGAGAVTGRTFVRRRRWVRTCVKVQKKKLKRQQPQQQREDDRTRRLGEERAEEPLRPEPPARESTPAPEAAAASADPPPPRHHSLPSKLTFQEEVAPRGRRKGGSLRKKWSSRKKAPPGETGAAGAPDVADTEELKFDTERGPGAGQPPPAPAAEEAEADGLLCFHVFENERRDVQHTKWGRFRLPTDPHRWSNLSATKSQDGPAGQPGLSGMERSLPEPPRAGLAWKWVSDWDVDTAFAASGETDESGWAYAIDWRPWLISHEADSSNFPSGAAQCTAAHFVRRRRWVRKRVLVGQAPGVGPSDLAKEFLAVMPDCGSEGSVIGEVTESMYENERRDVRFTRWGSEQKPSDPARWSDALAKEASPVFWDVAEEAPPPGHVWTDEAWLPDTSEALSGLVDRAGWCYAVDFFPWLISKSNKPLFPSGKPQPSVTSFVRRRRWVRRCAPASEPPRVAPKSEAARLVVNVPSVLKDLTGPGRWPHAPSESAPVHTLQRSVSSPELRRPPEAALLPAARGRGSPEHTSDTEQEAPGGFFRGARSCRLPDLGDGGGREDRSGESDSEILQVRRIPTLEYERSLVDE